MPMRSIATRQGDFACSPPTPIPVFLDFARRYYAWRSDIFELYSTQVKAPGYIVGHGAWKKVSRLLLPAQEHASLAAFDQLQYSVESSVCLYRLLLSVSTSACIKIAGV